MSASADALHNFLIPYFGRHAGCGTRRKINEPIDAKA
jgi:hypothetical protein